MGTAALSKSKAYQMPVFIIIVLGLILFLTAGSLNYWPGWIFWTIISAFTMFIPTYFFKRNPNLLARRMPVKDQENVRKSPTILKLFFLIYFIPGFDFRFHWSVMPVWTVFTADFMVFLGYVFIITVFKENSYASANIKVEEEQQVISTGPYAIVRHPMYTGMLVITLFTPLALGSYWAVIPGLLFIPWTVFRIKSEEELLLRELPGYQDYCTKTPYRLIPSVW